MIKEWQAERLIVQTTQWADHPSWKTICETEARFENYTPGVTDPGADPSFDLKWAHFVEDVTGMVMLTEFLDDKGIPFELLFDMAELYDTVERPCFKGHCGWVVLTDWCPSQTAKMYERIAANNA